MKKSDIVDLSSDTASYADLVVSIKERILKSQYEALKAVNKELIALYWDIGKSIVEKQNEFGWGKSIVKNLADDLQKEFVGIKGFSAQNLWNMRLFYLKYKENEKLQTLSREIGYSDNVAFLISNKEYISYTHVNTLLPPLLNVPKKEFSV